MPRTPAMLLTFGVLLGAAHAANPHCLAALDRACEADKKLATCDHCLKENSEALKAAGCRLVDEQKFCASAPKPVSDLCWAALEKECASEQKTGEAKCDQCVEKVDRAKKLNCSHAEELKYCDAAPKPTPVEPSCEKQLDAICAPNMGNKGTTKECDDCVKKHADQITNCTTREELSWCAMAPEPRPVVDACEKELKKACGEDIKTDPAKCEACVKRLGPTENCTRREEATFCGAKPPAPSPEPISKKCELLLAGECTTARIEGEHECDDCAKKVGASDNCTLREELKFCADKPTPPAPTPAPPITDQCITFLRKDCAKAKEEGEKPCDECVAKLGAKEHCTKREELQFCGMAPIGPSHNISKVCEEKLHAECDAPKKEGLLQCENCVAKIGPEVKSCTLREELTFCNPPKPTPGPRPIDPGCEKELAILCSDARSNETACIACVREHEKVLIEREHCTRAEVMKFC